MMKKTNKTAIIPKPVQMVYGKGEFLFTDKTEIVNTHSGLKGVAIYLKNILDKHLNTDVHISESKTDNCIIFEFSLENIRDDEGYRLNVNENGITIFAKEGAGAFYAVQTLMQLFPWRIFSDSSHVDLPFQIPALEIVDKPRFKWRGMHLDVSRHFFPMDFIKRYIDLLAMHKLNKFHWHLTDDNGWRIEIKKYPELTKISARRVYRDKWRGAEPSRADEKPTYGGFYTQDEIKEIIDYANERFIEIIPEIEMPGHSSEIFAAFPNLSCDGKKEPVPVNWGGKPFCAGNDEVFDFLENVLDEVVELFPSKYIHIGGDEVDKKFWKKCKKCQKRIRENNLKNEDELQSWFIKRIEKYLLSKGKYIIGWDEILEGGVAEQATVMSWRGTKGGIEAAKQGHNVVLCPDTHCYFDHYQAEPAFEPEAIGGFTTLKKVYSFNPLLSELSNEEKRYILGAQGNVWTEFMFTQKSVEYMALPRMSALSEVVWTAKREWNDFRRRMEAQFKRFDAMNLNYSKGCFKVDISAEKLDSGEFIITMEQEQLLPIHYTLNGSEPDKDSPIYVKPFKIKGSCTIKAALFENGKVQRKVWEKKIG